MNYSLINHQRGYQLSCTDVAFDLVTGCSGATFAKRHYQIARADKNHALAHYTICAIEAVPLFGALAALIERITYTLFGGADTPLPWRSHFLSPSDAQETMLENARFAVEARRGNSAFAGVSSAVARTGVLGRKETTPLRFTHNIAEAQGPRLAMEDAHFYKKLEQGILTGVFDGHGGDQVSKFASAEFPKRFSAVLKKAEGNVHQVFEEVFHQIQLEVTKHPDWNSVGSTAVVCYIDKATHQIYTATLGDSEANIYRRSCYLSTTKSIALSLVKDWTSPSEMARLIAHWGKKAVTKFFTASKHPKQLRAHLNNGVNVSRALGDVGQTGSPEAPLVIHEPLITVNKVRKGDLLILACDGLKDYVPESDIIRIIREGKNALAHRLARYAVHDKRGRDNVTVLTVDIKASA